MNYNNINYGGQNIHFKIQDKEIKTNLDDIYEYIFFNKYKSYEVKTIR